MRQAAAALDISAEMAGIHAAAYEREREPVDTILHGDLAICLLQLELSRAEQLLAAHGHHDAVRGQRDADPSLTLLSFTFAPPRRRPTT